MFPTNQPSTTRGPTIGGTTIDGRALAAGRGMGELLCADVPLSFWGGVDPLNGRVVDAHHPLRGRSLAGRVLVLPGGRGSCSGSLALLELALNGRGPAAIVVRDQDTILALGAHVADEMFGRPLPVLRVGPEGFAALLAAGARRAVVDGSRIRLVAAGEGDDAGEAGAPAAAEADAGVRLAPIDRAFLDGHYGGAARVAMRLVLRAAALEGAERLVDVTRVHVDACVYTGPASLAFARRLLALGGRFRVPTTLNAASVDQRHWRAQGVDPALGVPASALADAYVALGARPTYTCAPYLLDDPPAPGERVAWAESNAVAYANSVLGARTMKVPDLLDALIALTGRAPLAGPLLDAGRHATLALDAERPAGADDAYWPLLGLLVGDLAGAEVPLVRGLERATPSPDDLKAFAAAFATTGAAPMFHVAGVTPEAASQAPGRAMRIERADLRRAWEALNAGPAERVDLVCLGSPHLSFAECASLAALARAALARGPALAPVVATLGRAVHAAARAAGHLAAAEAFGVRFVTDTCWCMIGEPVVPAGARVLMTNSGKYARYGTGLTGRAVRFGSMADCVEAARTGSAPAEPPAWLR